MTSTPIKLTQFAPLTGTYKGTANVLNFPGGTIVPGTATTISAVLIQSATANVDGMFPLSGTVSTTGACTGSIAFTNGVVTGDGFFSYPLSGPIPSQGVFFGALDFTGPNISDGVIEMFPTCSAPAYQGPLTRQ